MYNNISCCVFPMITVQLCKAIDILYVNRTDANTKYNWTSKTLFRSNPPVERGMLFSLAKSKKI